MNHFQYGFFNELEKIATNRALVAKHTEMYRQQYPGASKGEIGEAATRLAQLEARTRGRVISTPSKADGGFRFDVQIPNPKKRGDWIFANPEQSRKHNARIYSRANALAMSEKHAPANRRAYLDLKPYGHVSRRIVRI